MVVVATGIPFLRGRLPGCEPAPYIIRFTEDRPNPIYRRICYSFAWGEAVTFAVLNIVGLIVAITTGTWMLKEIYRYGYFPMAGLIWAVGLLGASAAREAVDAGRGTRAPLLLRHGLGRRRCAAGALVALPDDAEGTGARTRSSCVVFVGVLAAMGWRAYKGKLPRTRPIVPGELAALD